MKIIMVIAYTVLGSQVGLSTWKERRERRRREKWVKQHREELLGCKDLDRFLYRSRSKLNTLWVACKGPIYNSLEEFYRLEDAQPYLQLVDRMEARLIKKHFPEMLPRTLYVWLEEEVPKRMLQRIHEDVQQLKSAEELYDLLKHINGIFDTPRKWVKERVARWVREQNFDFYHGHTGWQLQHWYEKQKK